MGAEHDDQSGLTLKRVLAVLIRSAREARLSGNLDDSRYWLSKAMRAHLEMGCRFT